MANVQLSENIVSEAKIISKALNRLVEGQIERQNMDLLMLKLSER